MVICTGGGDGGTGEGRGMGDGVRRGREGDFGLEGEGRDGGWELWGDGGWEGGEEGKEGLGVLEGGVMEGWG